MRVVITGGAGFIGSNLARVLSSDPGTEVVVVDDLSSGDIANLDGVRAAVVTGSILDPRVLDTAVAGADAIVHLAALSSVAESADDPRRYHEVNVTGTLAVLEAARSNGSLHTVLASSSSVYGSVPRDDPRSPSPISPYAVGKLTLENYGRTWMQAFDVPVLALRFFNVFGPRQRSRGHYPAVVPSFIDAALEGRTVDIFGTGRQTRDFVHVDLVTSVVAEALRSRIASLDAVDIGNGRSTDLLQLLDVVAEAVGRPLQVEHHPPRPGDIAESLADVTRLDELFPDRPRFDLADAVRGTVEWTRAGRG